MAAGDKDPGALKTIGELSRELGVAQHILRYWETRFPQLKPMQRAGNRRYYRPADVELVRRIHTLLGQEGYTVRGVRKVLGGKDLDSSETAKPTAESTEQTRQATTSGNAPKIDIFRLVAIRDRLAALVEG